MILRILAGIIGIIIIWLAIKIPTYPPKPEELRGGCLNEPNTK